MKSVCEDYPELALPIKNHIIKDFDASNYDSVKSCCDKFNRAIAQINLLVSIRVLTHFTYACRVSPLTIHRVFLSCHYLVNCFEIFALAGILKLIEPNYLQQLRKIFYWLEMKAFSINRPLRASFLA